MGYIYMLVEDLPAPLAKVKIGYSSKIESLRSRLATHCASNEHWLQYCFMHGSMGDEKAIHTYFDDLRAGRSSEIFHLKGELIDYLESLATKWFIAATVDELDSTAFIDHRENEVGVPGPGFGWAEYPSHSLFDPKVGEIVRAPLPLDKRRPQNTNEWYTPQEYVEAARRVMGGIDLDPATSHAANRCTVRASTFYTVQNNGLAMSNKWHGRVWLNPPYGGEQIDFIDRCLREYELGNIEAAILCLNGNAAMSGNKWFRPLFNHVICFSGRVRFEGGPTQRDIEDPMNNPMNTTCFVYIGKDELAFQREFVEFGPIMAPLERRCAS